MAAGREIQMSTVAAYGIASALTTSTILALGGGAAEIQCSSTILISLGLNILMGDNAPRLRNAAYLGAVYSFANLLRNDPIGQIVGFGMTATAGLAYVFNFFNEPEAANDQAAPDRAR